MAKDIPLTIETLSGKDAEHLITAAKEIEFVLRGMAKHGSRVAVYYSGANYFFLSTLLGVDNKGMWFEQSPNSMENKRAAESDDLVLVSAHLQAKVQFAAGHANIAEYGSYPAFYLPLPKSIYRLQRRDFFRLAVPASEPLHCCIAAGNTPTKKPCKLTIVDISGGGAGLDCKELDFDIAPGDLFEDCQIDLPEIGTIIGTLEVKSLAISTSPSGRTNKRAGCEFKNLDAKSTNLLQRYVTNMQRAKSNLQ